jgi:predicted naringenin-chalcone synthase
MASITAAVESAKAPAAVDVKVVASSEEEAKTTAAAVAVKVAVPCGGVESKTEERKTTPATRGVPADLTASIGLPPLRGSTVTAPGGNTARICALASAFPPNTYTQSQYLAAFLRNHIMTPADEDFTRRVWAGTGFDTCSSYLPEEKLFVKMKRSEYLPYIKNSLRDMGLRSAREAIEQWGGPISSITHIVFGTMTGSIHAPTMDVEIALALGLPVGIKRLNVEGMGCLTGFRCLGLASDIARADPSHVVLLIVCDIRSALGNQLSPHKPREPIDKSNVIVSSLFRDSGASAIVSSAAQGKVYKPAIGATPASIAPPLYEVVEHRSALLPGTFDRVKYTERDDAVIHLYIAKELPEDIKRELPAQVKALLDPHGLKPSDCTFAVHTGGPKVLNYVAEGLGLDSKARMASSWYCMKKWGNLSGSSNLVVLDQWRKLPPTAGGELKEYTVAMSFGPGVGMELVLLRALSPEVPFTV